MCTHVCTHMYIVTFFDCPACTEREEERKKGIKAVKQKAKRKGGNMK